MTIAFTKVKLHYGWLGNMSPHPVVMFGVKWPTAEHAFQVGRFSPDHPVRVGNIHRIKSPIDAKTIINSYRDDMIITPTSDDDIDLMEEVLRSKLTQNSLHKALLATGDQLIVEDTSARPYGNGLFWGARYDGYKWVGENVLGMLWMVIRDDLRDSNMG